MRIIGGAWRGRVLAAPPGATTRPTAERMRQALFDMLLHAPWSDRESVIGATVLDAFAGTGALGLEALSRGAVQAHFIEPDRAALVALRANIATCRASAVVHAASALRPPPGLACGLVFLDPPYGAELVDKSLAALAPAGWIAPGALIVAETGRDEPLGAFGTVLAERLHGAARVTFMRAG